MLNTPVLAALQDRFERSLETMRPLASLDVPADAARALAGELATMNAYPIPITSEQAVYENLVAGTVRLFGVPVHVVGGGG